MPGTRPVDDYLGGTSETTAGALGLSSGGPVDTLTWTDAGRSETSLISTPEGQQTDRRVFLSEPLQQDLRLSGTPVVDIRAALSKTQSNLGAILVDYGAGTQITHAGEGIANTTERYCWGSSTTRTDAQGAPIDHGACYLKVSKPVISVTQWRISRGILDSANRTSLRTSEPVTIGDQTRFAWPLVPQDYVIPAGHRLGIVLTGNSSGFGVFGTPGATFTLDAKASKVTLPVVGGYRAAAATRAFAPDTSAPVLARMPADIVVGGNSGRGAMVVYPLPTATDDETPDPVVACDPGPASTFPVGATTVTCTATDAYGNATTHAFTVTVVGPGSPPPSNSTGGGPSQTGDVVPRPPRPADTVAPVLSRLTMSPLPHALLRLRFTMSETARLTVIVLRKGAKRPVKVMRVRVRAGRRTLRLRPGRLRRDRYTVEIRATDAAGNAAVPHRRAFKPRVLNPPAAPTGRLRREGSRTTKGPRSRALRSTATGIRTPVSAVRGRRPSPLDDGGRTRNTLAIG